MKINEEEIGRGRDIRILMVLSSYFGRHFGGSFVFHAVNGQAFGCVKFPMTGQAFGCVKFSKKSGYKNLKCSLITKNYFTCFTYRFCKISNSRIGYWNLEMKGFDGYLEIGDELSFFKTSCYWILDFFWSP
ncbi:unnamed protein product [Rhizophagus irregularis]|nr:unnamed protein product [Rhizophagus irregularis]